MVQDKHSCNKWSGVWKIILRYLHGIYALPRTQQVNDDVCISMYVCMYSCMCICTYVCMYVCIYVCVCMYVCMYARIITINPSPNLKKGLYPTIWCQNYQNFERTGTTPTAFKTFRGDLGFLFGLWPSLRNTTMWFAEIHVRMFVCIRPNLWFCWTVIPMYVCVHINPYVCVCAHLGS